MKRDLNDRLAFTQVVNSGSFTAGAAVLGLPKSTVSRRISRLEEHLGARLLHRTTRTLNLTDAGRTLYDRSVRIVAEVDDAERAVMDLGSGPRGRLRVTAPVEFLLVHQLISGFLNQYPEVQIDLDLTNRNVDLVAEGFDVALRGGALADSTLIAQKLGQLESTLIASPAYLARRGRPASPEELMGHDCVLFGPWSVNGNWVLVGPDGPVKVAVKGRLSVNHMHAVRHAALAGFGIALLPSDWTAADIDAGTLCQVLPGVSGQLGVLWVVYPSRRQVPPTLRAFVDFLKMWFHTPLTRRDSL